MTELAELEAPAADVAVLTPIGTPADEPWTCPYCGVNSRSGPEGADWAGHHHCWHCGYDPGKAPVLAGSLPGLPAPGVTAAVAQQIAGQIHELLGLPAGTNLGDLLGQLKQAAQPERVAVES